jgi:hypothetical protein
MPGVRRLDRLQGSWSPCSFSSCYGPVIALYMMNILLAGIGIFFFLALTPLLGLAPEDKRSLYVLPVGMLLYCALGLVFVYLVVPGTPADVQFQLAGEIITSAKYRLLLMGSIGLLLAVVYVTLYRRLYPRLPAWLRTETIHLTWKDLRLPAGLAAVSVILGLIIIT